MSGEDRMNVDSEPVQAVEAPIKVVEASSSEPASPASLTFKQQLMVQFEQFKTQLTVGCGSKSCTNPDCASSKGFSHFNHFSF